MAIDYLSLVHNGLPKADKPKRVIVVGAGMAGLVAAYELLRAGHDPVLLEGRQRVGGRILTLRDPFSHGLIGEAGAMRIPQAHALTMAYVEKFAIKTLPFTPSNPQGYCFIDGKKMRLADVQKNPDELGFELHPHERGKSVSALWDAAIAPLQQKISDQGEAAWDEIAREYDEYSLREFFDAQKWSEGAIELYGLLAGYESRMNSSFVDILRAEIGHAFKGVVRLEGGMDALPNAFLPSLRERIRFGAKMVAMDQSPNDVTIHYKTHAGRQAISGDYAIITTPFSVLRHIEAIKPFWRGKQRAIRELNYDASVKIFLQCRRRFWETEDGISGGASVTDLAIRSMYYPDHGRETGRGVLLASYTWAEDAERWASLDPRDRITEALEDVAQIHPQVNEEFEVGASKVWHEDEFAGGAFALFEPGQQTHLYADIIKPEGRFHFAGEHASLTHRWIQGAVESGLRAANEICSAK